MKIRAFTRADLLATLAVFCILTLLALPLLAQEANKSKRVKCAENLRTIVQACIKYAEQNNDQYPWLPGDSASTYDVTLKPELGNATAGETINTIYKEKPYPNNPYAVLWLLCLTQDAANPKVFVCPEDSFGAAPAERYDNAKKRWYPNFQDGKNVSYSVAYMWEKRNDKIVRSTLWNNTDDASLPILSDMAPYLGKDAKPGEISEQNAKAPVKSACSPNHAYEGQNVAFADNHVDWYSRSDVGQTNDNIWTQSPGGLNAKDQIIEAGKLPADYQPDTWPPWDIVMVPTRSAKGDLK